MDTTQLEKDIFDPDDDKDTDIKINPNYYIHTTILNSEKTMLLSLFKTNIGEGILGYKIFIERLEVICKAAKYINEDYHNEVKEYLNSEEILKENNPHVKTGKIANKKLELLLTSVFKRAPLRMPLKG